MDKIKILLLKTEKTTKLAVYFDYRPHLVEQIKKIEGRRYNPQYKRWELPLSKIGILKREFPDAEYSDGVKEYFAINEEKQKLLSEEYNKIIEGIDLEKPLPTGKRLFHHQIVGIKRLIRNRRMILADDMGLGKTLQSLVAAKLLSDYYGNYQIVVICPVSLMENWIREANSINIKNISVYSWAKQPNKIDNNYILIADEAHYAQAGSKTKRGKNFLKLSEADNCKACFCLSGTPVKNGRPINLFPLLKATRHELAMDKSSYMQRYCNAHIRKVGRRQFWDINGSSNLQELHEKISNIMIRRTKKDCLDLPDKIRVLREAELSEQSISLYNETLNNLRKEYQRRLSEGIIKNEGEALVMLQHIAHAGAYGKIETAYELGEEVIEEGNQVVIFSTFTEPLLELQKRFNNNNIPVSLLIGATKNRQEVVDEFLAEKSKVFLLSMAGGVGIDLYSASTIILINRAWTPGDVLQIEDRLHRIGQKKSVTSIWLQYGEVDKHVDEILQRKSININEILTKGGKDDDIIRFANRFFTHNE